MQSIYKISRVKNKTFEEFIFNSNMSINKWDTFLTSETLLQAVTKQEWEGE